MVIKYYIIIKYLVILKLFHQSFYNYYLSMFIINHTFSVCEIQNPRDTESVFQKHSIMYNVFF